MSDDCLLGLGKLRKSLKKAQKNSILLLIILVAATGLFFSNLIRINAYAQKAHIEKEISLSSIDPMERIGRGTFPKENGGEICKKYSEQDSSVKAEKSEREKEYENLVRNHPIEAMVPKISQKDEAVAAFLIGIAKKESDWGKHSPKKGGRDCYNYWGYKGGYNPTDSGYSCFDSPEQAVDVVGGRIGDLVGKKIDTPSRMIVWKCGRSCAGHDPAGVKKWISDVSLYYNKLVS